jgi:hypothetical protein
MTPELLRTSVSVAAEKSHGDPGLALSTTLPGANSMAVKE